MRVQAGRPLSLRLSVHGVSFCALVYAFFREGLARFVLRPCPSLLLLFCFFLLLDFWGGRTLLWRGLFVPSPLVSHAFLSEMSASVGKRCPRGKTFFFHAALLLNTITTWYALVTHWPHRSCTIFSPLPSHPHPQGLAPPTSPSPPIMKIRLNYKALFNPTLKKHSPALASSPQATSPTVVATK